MNKSILKKLFLAIKTIVTRRLVIEHDRIPFEIRNMSYKKILNWILVSISDLFKMPKPWGYPVYVQIEPTTYCNLKCYMCPVTRGMNRPNMHLDFSVYKKFIDEAGEYLFSIVLWDWGEPFLNPELFNIISYAKKRNIKVITSTNGHLLKSKNNADKVINSKLDSIIVAIDGISQNTYEQFRTGGNLDTVIEGIKTLVERKKALNSRTPLIIIRTVAMRQNENEIPEIKKMAENIGADAYSIKTFDYFYASETKKIRSEYLPENQRLWRWILDENGFPKMRDKNPCSIFQIATIIHSNGAVCPCWMDIHEKHPLGDLNKLSFHDIWFGKKYSELRKQFKDDWTKNELCRECTYAYEGGSCTGETIAEITFFNR